MTAAVLNKSAVAGKRISELANCTDIFDPAINVIECVRPQQSALADWVERISPFSVPFVAEIDASEGNVPQLYQAVESCLSDSFLPEPDVIIPDVQALAELYVHLVAPAAIGLRITYLTEAMCSKWHQDYVGIRLVSTYGSPNTPGTQWVDPEYVDHTRLGFRNNQSRDDSEEVLRDCSKIKTMLPFSIGLLKGANWQGNEASPAIHRSPDGYYKRVLVSMDSLS